MIKRKIAAALVGLSLIGAVSTAAAQDKELIVATDTAFVPFEFKQGSTYTGFDIDLWAAIAKELNLKYKLQPMDFTGIIPGLQTKNIDAALAGLTIPAARKQVIDRSDERSAGKELGSTCSTRWPQEYKKKNRVSTT